MLILLPPSEGKTRPSSGPVLDLETLSFPRLTPVRAQLMRALIKMCSGHPRRAMQVLGLGLTQADAIEINAGLDTEPTARADEIYTGVLFSMLDVATLDRASRARADESLFSAPRSHSSELRRNRRSRRRGRQHHSRDSACVENNGETCSLKGLASWPSQVRAVVEGSMMVFVWTATLLFAAVPMCVYDDKHQDRKSQRAQYHNHWPLLPGLAQEFEKVLNH